MIQKPNLHKFKMAAICFVDHHISHMPHNFGTGLTCQNAP